jgi:Domain of unknown function (DUF4956)
MPTEPMSSTDYAVPEEVERPRPTAVSRGWMNFRPVSSTPGTQRGDSGSRPEWQRSLRWLASVASGILLCLGLVVTGPYLPKHSEPLRLAIAAFIGLLVTAVHRRPSQEADAQPMQHAQVLLCVSGAMMMVIINDSLARAFGIAGAASIIRFRTPVDDPRDAAVLFLLMALGMASGLGAYALAGSGAAMLCLFLLFLGRLTIPKTRSMLVELISATSAFPADHVQRAFARHGVSVELREMSHGEPATARYLAMCPSNTSLEALNADLITGTGNGLRAVAWEPAKKKQL